MRTLILTSLLLLFFTCSVTAQADTSGMVIYRLHYNTDSPQNDRFDTLYFNRNNYLYISKWKAAQFNDDRGFTINRAAKNERFQYPASLATRIELAQDYRKKRITYQKDSIEPIAWTFVDEFKEINGVRAQKATAKSMPYSNAKTIIAWFATDVPIRVGPGGLYGLPGLIVEGYIYPDWHHRWTVETIEYQPVTISDPNPADYNTKNGGRKDKRKKNNGRTRLDDALKGSDL